jgi:hypothetical protein
MKNLALLALTILLGLLSCGCSPEQATFVQPTDEPTPVLSLPSFAPPSKYESKTVSCETYISATWGSGLNQWGDPVNLGRAHDSFSAPVFTPKGDLLLTDYANRRLLVYDGNKQTPIRVIRIPDEYYSSSSFETLRSPVYSIAVSDEFIVVPYDLQMMGVLSSDGQVVSNIRLPYSFNSMSPVSQPLWIDSYGGLLFNGEKIAYFAPGWQTGTFREISAGSDWLLEPFYWEGYIGAQSGALQELWLYRIDYSIDFLTSRSEVQTGLPPTAFLIGADGDGHVYFEVTSTTTSYMDGAYIVNFSLKDHTGAVGKLPNDIASSIISAAIAPNGNIYFVVYENNDSTDQPMLVRCHLINEN